MSSEPEPEFPPECVDGTTLSTGRFMRCFNTSVTSSGGFTTEEIAENRNKYVNGQPNKNNHWWLAGGAIVGIGLSLGVFYAAASITQ